MIAPGFVRTMAAYNRWQNDSVYTAADALEATARGADRGAFFGSIEGTLNHILWGDLIWMSRFTEFEGPRHRSIAASVRETESWAELKQRRGAVDRDIAAWAAGLSEADLSCDLSWYSGAMKRDMHQPMWLAVAHLFNHQTHHRGQVHAMLTAAGAQPDDTDLAFMPARYLDEAS
jgi:uncharacterized damage-inducible protein DinB